MGWVHSRTETTCHTWVVLGCCMKNSQIQWQTESHKREVQDVPKSHWWRYVFIILEWYISLFSPCLSFYSIILQLMWHWFWITEITKGCFSLLHYHKSHMVNNCGLLLVCLKVSVNACWLKSKWHDSILLVLCNNCQKAYCISMTVLLHKWVMWQEFQ